MPINSDDTDTQTQEDPGKGAGAAAQTPEQIQAELERTRAALKEANAESGKRRKRLEELEKAEQERQQAQLSDTEKLTKERDELKSKWEKAQSETAELTKRHAVEMAAVTAKFSKPAHYVHALISAAGLKIEVGEDGTVTGIDEAIKKLKADMPELFEKPADPPPKAPPKGTPPAQGNRKVGEPAQANKPTATVKF